jgi:peptidoglycan/LPS O-acetylase OafA/YrhL
MALIAAQFPLWLGGALLAQCWEAWAPRARPWLLPASVFWIIGAYVAHVWLLGRHVPVSVLVLLGWLVLPGWLGLVLGSTRWPGLLALKPVAGWLGMLSYPLYILHQPLLDTVVAAVHARGMHLGFAEACVILGGFVMACMGCAGMPLEAWILRWRACLLKKRRNTTLGQRASCMAHEH